MGAQISLLNRAPKIDADTGLHARDCECLRCDSGYRPTESQRMRALNDRRHREQLEAARALAEANAQRRELGAAAARMSAREREQATDRLIAEQAEQARRAAADETMKRFLAWRRAVPKMPREEAAARAERGEEPS